MTREELIEVMARAIHEERQKAGFGGEASWEHEPKSIHALHLHTATAALVALEAAGVRLVPVEATEEMVSAYYDEMPTPYHIDMRYTGEARQAIEHVLSASPYAKEPNND